MFTGTHTVSRIVKGLTVLRDNTDEQGVKVRADRALDLIQHAQAASHVADEMVAAFHDRDYDAPEEAVGAGLMLAAAQDHAATQWLNVSAAIVDTMAAPF